METRYEKRREVDDSSVTRKEGLSLGYYTVVALFGILAIGYAINLTKYISSLQTFSTQYDSLLYSALMAVSEEMFFRGFITDFLLTASAVTSIKILKIGYPYNALILSATIFMGYHFARYGTQFDALIYVFAGGFILSWVAFKSKRLGPSMLAHSITNIISVLGGF